MTSRFAVKKSNRVLLLIFSMPLIVLLLLYGTMYARYKAGYVKVTDAQHVTTVPQHTLPVIHRVGLVGSLKCNISTAGDTASIGFIDTAYVQFKVIGDSLAVWAKDSSTDGHHEQDFNNKFVSFNLPGNVVLYSTHSDIDVSGPNDSSKAPSYQFILGKGVQLAIVSMDDSAYPSQYFAQFKVVAAEGANVQLDHHAVIKDFGLQMTRGDFDDDKARIENLSVIADKESKLEIHGDNLMKLQRK